MRRTPTPLPRFLRRPWQSKGGSPPFAAIRFLLNAGTSFRGLLVGPERTARGRRFCRDTWCSTSSGGAERSVRASVLPSPGPGSRVDDAPRFAMRRIVDACSSGLHRNPGSTHPLRASWGQGRHQGRGSKLWCRPLHPGHACERSCPAHASGVDGRRLCERPAHGRHRPLKADPDSLGGQPTAPRPSPASV